MLWLINWCVFWIVSFENYYCTQRSSLQRQSVENRPEKARKIWQPNKFWSSTKIGLFNFSTPIFICNLAGTGKIFRCILSVKIFVCMWSKKIVYCILISMSLSITNTHHHHHHHHEVELNLLLTEQSGVNPALDGTRNFELRGNHNGWCAVESSSSTTTTTKIIIFIICWDP